MIKAEILKAYKIANKNADEAFEVYDPIRRQYIKGGITDSAYFEARNAYQTIMDAYDEAFNAAAALPEDEDEDEDENMQSNFAF